VRRNGVVHVGEARPECFATSMIREVGGVEVLCGGLCRLRGKHHGCKWRGWEDSQRRKDQVRRQVRIGQKLTLVGARKPFVPAYTEPQVGHSHVKCSCDRKHSVRPRMIANSAAKGSGAATRLRFPDWEVERAHRAGKCIPECGIRSDRRFDKACGFGRDATDRGKCLRLIRQ
jgi:hypothetical protein